MRPGDQAGVKSLPYAVLTSATTVDGVNAGQPRRVGALAMAQNFAQHLSWKT
jgi:hypothetical protein